MKKAVILDGYTLNPGDLTWEKLEEITELIVYERTAYSKSGADLIIERGRDAEILIVNKTPVTGEMMDKMERLEYIGVLATGYDVVDTAAAKARGITVTNVPTYGTAAVSQMAIALLLELCMHVGEHNRAVKNGEWAENPDWCFWKYPLVELDQKTMGIFGYGRIGRATGKIAQAMGMKVLACDIYPDKSLENENMKYTDADTLFKESDVICLHCPLTAENRELIRHENILKMKDGVMIINNSRGALVNEEDLAKALRMGKVAGAALDVVSTEPILPDNPLLKEKNCIITPHISWAPKEARERLMEVAVENIRAYLSGAPINTVTR